MNDYIDISVGISASVPTWPGSPQVVFSSVHDMQHGDTSTDSNIFLNVHTATHIDAPSHFVPNGKTVDDVSLGDLIGEAYVVKIPDDIKGIGWDTLEEMGIPESVDRLLLLTSNSNIWGQESCDFEKDYAALTESGARWVVDRGIKLVGIDYLSIQRYSDGPEAHQILLGSEVIILEGINLNGVTPGMYELICLPIKLVGLEGAPARAVIRKLSI